MDEQEIASLLASANHQGGSEAMANIDADGNVIAEVPVQNTQVTPAQADPIVKAPPKKDLSPEEAVALLDELEGKHVNEQGNLESEAPVVVEEDADEVPFEKLTTAEKIAKLQEELDIENGVVKDPLETVNKKVADAGLEISDIEAQYINDGQLSEENLKSLKDAGFDDTAIEAYISTKVASETAKANQAVTEVFGTPEKFAEMQEWMIADDNLTDAEIAQYNKGVQGEHYKVYLESMYSRFSKEQAPVTRTIRQSATQNVGRAQGFATQSEMVKAMQDPRYRNDIEYRKAVQQKVSLMK